MQELRFESVYAMSKLWRQVGSLIHSLFSPVTRAAPQQITHSSVRPEQSLVTSDGTVQQRNESTITSGNID